MELKVPAPLVNIAHDLQLSSIYPQCGLGRHIKRARYRALASLAPSL
jgi:hypothetical protein